MHNDSNTRLFPLGVRDRRFSRRTFLALSTSLVGGLLAACRPAPSRPRVSTDAERVPVRILPSPQAQPETGAVDSEALANFLALSSLLTGVAPLDPVLGSTYLVYLQETHASTLTELYEQAGFAATAPTTLQALEATGIFTVEAMRQLTDQILALWYTGTYKNKQGDDVVVTFVDALAWKGLAFTKPPTICGAPHFWAKHPRETLLDLDA